MTPRRSSVTRSGDSNKLDIQPAQFFNYTSFGGKNHFPLIRDETSIGRNTNNHIVLADPKISKYHAIVKRVMVDGEKTAYYIKDKNSSNGVRVNSINIIPDTLHRLHDGDKVSIGVILLTFVDEHPTGVPTPAMSSWNDSISNSLNRASRHQSMYLTKEDEEKVKLVTILPSESKYEETVTISAEIEDEDIDFRPLGEVKDSSTLKEDYEKLRLAYELSKISLTNDITPLLAKSLDLMFEILPVDRGVVLLVDETTGNLVTHYVKLREGSASEGKEILLSSTILRRVFDTRISVISRDATEDPQLGMAASVKHGQIRSVICVPLIAHAQVHGILHLDSRDRLNSSFSKKDLSLVKAISNQTAMAIENMILMREVETKARITEQLSRFLPPHVVDKMAERGNIIQRSGREMVGTVMFVDIRGFTNLSESIGPAEVVNILNDYFERLVRVVFKYEGVVDKYIGDALMAVFGTLDEEVDSEYRSVATAMEWLETIRDMNEIRERQGKKPIRIGVGVNTGNLLAGFIGSAQRLEYTCIGDTVNTSSRISDMATNDQVLISESTYERVKQWVRVEPFGPRMFKGKKKEVMIYQVLSIDKK
ncbi:adenylyl cyclase [Rhizoclosmatium globosum]|uniref:Adenylyl cyclase n=1 Tax=Rhizoclosmatium globosum TaxID=329046 RepID=A0A1Y2CS84_9FUNG|nr:adenylyl cyclase [Rhizoclosmatium globosum]|eukprot:ORY49833.1 adenylyl cyclase [Rhizoclosmatium globosum]